MWKKYEVELRFTTPFASSAPKNPKDIEAMLTARAPSEPELKKRAKIKSGSGRAIASL
jgi:hypothetical protein